MPNPYADWELVYAEETSYRRLAQWGDGPRSPRSFFHREMLSETRATLVYDLASGVVSAYA